MISQHTDRRRSGHSTKKFTPLMQLIYPAVQEAIDRSLYPEGDVELQRRIADDMAAVRATPGALFPVAIEE